MSPGKTPQLEPPKPLFIIRRLDRSKVYQLSFASFLSWHATSEFNTELLPGSVSLLTKLFPGEAQKSGGCPK